MKGQSIVGLASGTRFCSYEIVCPIASGGMGVVYRAIDVRLDRVVAIKTLPANCLSDSFRLRAAEREARALSSINNPNIVTLYTVGKVENVYYIVMEFVEGWTLRQQISTGRLTLTAALNIATQMTSALSAAHSAGVLHRDIKPENVMVRPDGLVKVLDFGLAKLKKGEGLEQSLPNPSRILNQGTLTFDHLDAGHSQHTIILNSPTRHSAESSFFGTPGYMSPEQLCGRESDARSDIFSLGVTLYELLTGVRPFCGRSYDEIRNAILQEEPAPISCFRPEVPREVEHIISKALRKDREWRYQHIKDLLIDLQDVKSGLRFDEALERTERYGLLDAASRFIPGLQSCEIFAIESNQICNPITSVMPGPARGIVYWHIYPFRKVH